MALTFLALPAEVRLLIYSYVLAEGTYSIKVIEAELCATTFIPYPDVLRTCKKIFNEAAPTLPRTRTIAHSYHRTSCEVGDRVSFETQYLLLPNVCAVRHLFFDDLYSMTWYNNLYIVLDNVFALPLCLKTLDLFLDGYTIKNDWSITPGRLLDMFLNINISELMMLRMEGQNSVPGTFGFADVAGEVATSKQWNILSDEQYNSQTCICWDTWMRRWLLTPPTLSGAKRQDAIDQLFRRAYW